jgi:quercetin dioxygenase-like cupin family protein
VEDGKDVLVCLGVTEFWPNVYLKELHITLSTGARSLGPTSQEKYNLRSSSPHQRKELDKMYFQNLNQIVQSLDTDESTRNDPIKRVFVFDGKHLTANVGIVRENGNALHTQKDHDEILVIIEGDVDFRVGGEVKRVSASDLVFIPQNTLHGPILKEGQSFAALSVFAPYFDRSEKNISWERDST